MTELERLMAQVVIEGLKEIVKSGMLNTKPKAETVWKEMAPMIAELPTEFQTSLVNQILAEFESATRNA